MTYVPHYDREKHVDGILRMLREHKPTATREEAEVFVSQIEEAGMRLRDLKTDPEPEDEDDPLPPTLHFKYYLHDNYTRSEFAESVADQTGYELPEELMEKIGRPFYEVEFDCILDTETGEITYTVE